MPVCLLEILHNAFFSSHLMPPLPARRMDNQVSDLKT